MTLLTDGSEDIRTKEDLTKSGESRKEKKQEDRREERKEDIFVCQNSNGDSDIAEYKQIFRYIIENIIKLIILLKFGQ